MSTQNRQIASKTLIILILFTVHALQASNNLIILDMLKLPIKSSSQEIIITHKKHKVQSVSQPSLDLTRYLSNYLITYTVPNIVTFTRYLAFWATGTTFLQRKRLLWPELLTTSTCLSIPNLFIADHSCQRQSCSRRCHL